MHFPTPLLLALALFVSCTSLHAKDEKPGKPAKAASTKTTEGTFVRVDEGDYFHFVITDTKGEEVSFFILKGDATVDKVVEEPGKFVGKKCRVQWKTSVENIPEAGGKLEIEQILSVEWLGKK